MVIHGVTIVDTEGWIDGRESRTAFFVTKDDQINFAYAQYCSLFDSCDFENGKDENGFEED